MVCEVKCEVYSRVVGYYRPVHNWNNGKRQEFREREAFTEEHSLQNAKFKGDCPAPVVATEVSATEIPVVENAVDNADATPSQTISDEALEQLYKVFTVPHCEKCEEVKSFLKEKNLPMSIFDLKSPEGNKEFRAHYSNKSVKEMIKRDSDGALKLPIVFHMKKDDVVSTAQGLDETKLILA